ncbi:hypothetical protein SprV_0100002300 [Sparganum proliferum]
MPSVTDTAVQDRIAKNKIDSSQRGNQKNKKKSGCKIANKNEQPLLTDILTAPEPETMTTALSITVNAESPKTVLNAQKTLGSDGPSTSNGTEAITESKDHHSLPSISVASSKLVKTCVDNRNRDIECVSPPPSNTLKVPHPPERNTSTKYTNDIARDQCLVIQGLPESNANAPKERVSEDLRLFQGLLNNILEPTEAIEVVKAFRLGKRTNNLPTPTRPRPLKVVLACKEQDRWTRAVDGGNAVHAVYVDFKRAFDSVPHQRLLYRLSRTGIRGNLLRWIQSFLIGRSQIVHVDDRQSAEVAVESDVPQGSVLGPTLFIIYVNDCVSELNCDVAMFADDVKLWSVIRTGFDEERLQADLTRLEKWSQDWLLPFNVTKCNVLRVGRTRSLSRLEVDAQKDLGVWVTASLKPSLHCSKVAKSAMSVLYLVKRAFSTFDEDCFVKVFRTFVRPRVEFAIQAWKPWTSKDLSILEKVQGRATKLVSGQGSLPYETRLSNLGLFPLSYRQLRGDLIQTFRILRGHDCCLVPADFFELATTKNLRVHPLKLRVTCAKLDIRKFFFSNRVFEAWNALPTDVVMSTSVEAFKRKLDLCTTTCHNVT